MRGASTCYVAVSVVTTIQATWVHDYVNKLVAHAWVDG
jgi:hypothetical protein